MHNLVLGLFLLTMSAAGQSCNSVNLPSGFDGSSQRALRWAPERQGGPVPLVADCEKARSMAETEHVSAGFGTAPSDPAYNKPVLFRREAGPARVTIFEGSHEMLMNAAFAFLEKHRNPMLRCDDVTKLDVRSLTIRTAQRTFAFDDGIALNYDGPPVQDGKTSQPDWKAEIEKDISVHPAPHIAVRFLLIHDSHATGSGWRYYATGLRCSGGTLQEVFHRDGLSLSIDRLDSTMISVGLNITPGKAIREHSSYIWDRTTSKYILASSWLVPKAK